MRMRMMETRRRSTSVWRPKPWQMALVHDGPGNWVQHPAAAAPSISVPRLWAHATDWCAGGGPGRVRYFRTNP